MDIPASITAITGALQVVKELRAIDAQLDKADLKAKLADVMASLADAKIALVEANDALAAEKMETERLKLAFEFRRNLVEHHGFKYEAFDDGGPKGEPFCPRCEQNNGRFYRLTRIRGGGYSSLACPECKSPFQASTYVWEK